MTGRTIAKIRQADLQKIHIAKKQLGLSEDDYRAAVLSVSKGKTDSAGELDMQGRAALLAHFKRSGFKVRHARKDNAGKRRTPSRPVADRSEQVKMMRALWLRLHESGAVENADEQGLVTFAEKYTQKKALEWLSIEDCQKCIEILKKWLARVRIQPFRTDWYELHRLGAVGSKSDSFIRSALIRMCSVDVVECDLLHHAQTLDKVHAWTLDVINKQQ